MTVTSTPATTPLRRYSCYKVVPEASNWLSAMHTCWEDEAQLASFEDVHEMKRVVDRFQRLYGVRDVQAFTSGMHFADINKWVWVGASKSWVSCSN